VAFYRPDRKPERKSGRAHETRRHVNDLEPFVASARDDYVGGHRPLNRGRLEESNHNARPLDEILTDFPARQWKDC